jgi:UDPglucose--hexose-1-phosphate uridylyltransferase
VPHNELRKDYLLDRWVVIATERSRRPTDFAKQKTEPVKATDCPLCPGNEYMTPPAVLAYFDQNQELKKGEEQRDFRYKDWKIRVIPNLYPAFNPPDKPMDRGQIVERNNFGHAIGHHEVLIESPNHYEQPSDASVQQLINVIEACKDRLNALSQKTYVKYVQIFRNHGLEAGASLSHPHSQIIATPFVPTIVKKEVEASREYFDENGTCFFCDLIKKEMKNDRLIKRTSDFTVFSPYASVHPLEFWIIPNRHMINMLSLSKSETEELAKILRSALKALKELVNDPPYNFGIHLSINQMEKEYYHWHIEVYPHLSIWAGFEKSTGMYINTVTPENAAYELRKLFKL